MSNYTFCLESDYREFSPVKKSVWSCFSNMSVHLFSFGLQKCQSRCPWSWSYWLRAEQNLYLQGKFCLGLFRNIMQPNCVTGKLCVRNFILNCVLPFLCQWHPLFFAFIIHVRHFQVYILKHIFFQNWGLLWNNDKKKKAHNMSVVVILAIHYAAFLQRSTDIIAHNSTLGSVIWRHFHVSGDLSFLVPDCFLCKEFLPPWQHCQQPYLSAWLRYLQITLDLHINMMQNNLLHPVSRDLF